MPTCGLSRAAGSSSLPVREVRAVDVPAFHARPRPLEVEVLIVAVVVVLVVRTTAALCVAAFDGGRGRLGERGRARVVVASGLTLQPIAAAPRAVAAVVGVVADARCSGRSSRREPRAEAT